MGDSGVQPPVGQFEGGFKTEETARLWTVGKQRLNLWGSEEATRVRGIDEVIVPTQW